MAQTEVGKVIVSAVMSKNANLSLLTVQQSKTYFYPTMFPLVLVSELVTSVSSSVVWWFGKAQVVLC